MACWLLSLLLGATFLFECLTYLLWRYEVRVHGAPSPTGPLGPYVTSWLAEWAALLFALVASVVGALGRTRPARVAPSTTRPVVLLHGAGAGRGALALLAARLRRDGRETYSVAYPARGRDLDSQAASVAASLRDLGRATAAARFDVVAHGQGGVVVRAAARHHGCADMLANVVTLGAPHRGSTLAAFSGLRRRAPLRPGARFLEGLDAGDPLPARAHVTSIYSTYDAVVFPCELSYYPAAMNVRVDWAGHYALLASDRVYRLVKENLDVEPILDEPA